MAVVMLLFFPFKLDQKKAYVFMSSIDEEGLLDIYNDMKDILLKEAEKQGVRTLEAFLDILFSSSSVCFIAIFRQRKTHSKSKEEISIVYFQRNKECKASLSHLYMPLSSLYHLPFPYFL